jgi:hypothetical protein
VLAVLLAACTGEKQESPDQPGAAVPEKAARAARIADAIAAEPDRADAILEENGLSREEFEALLYEIAEDEALSQAYQAARRR